ncbi:hypothetical protein [Pseudalgibacter alginicilyticus]|uniref:hypothetical protein n=1 Tax=Pseudalgibacter alginicilyticus TaxID=1736674 RepID=UPI0012FD703C|nr:hypothetical protein [Pseudalgibacter alginicilyticus]
MLNDQQSLILCGILTVGIFVSGLLDILDNFIVLTILTITFIVILINIYLSIQTSQTEEIENEE